MTSQQALRCSPKLVAPLILMTSFIPSGHAQTVATIQGHQQALASTILKATEAYTDGDFEQSLQLYSDAFVRGATEITVPYNAACCAALCDKPELAFRLLNRAIDSGWLDIGLLEKDSDLASLHDDARWAELVDSVQKAIRLNEKRWKSTSFETPYADNLTNAEKAAGLSKLWSEVKFNFVNFHLVPELDWDAEYVAYMSKVLATESTFEYYRLLEKLVAKLKDAHTNVYLPEPINQRFNARPAFRTALIEGKVVVVKILDSAITAKGIAIGQELVAVNNVPVKEYAARHIRPYMSSSTPQDLEKRTFEHLLRGPVEEPIELELKNADGKTHAVTVDRAPAASRIARFFSQQPAFKMTLLDGNVAHVQLNNFSTSAALTAFAAAFEKIEASEGLILDLRKNGGGNSSVGRNILGFLTNQPLPNSRWYTLQYRPTFRAWNRQPLSKHGSTGGFAPPNSKHFKKPVVMLIGTDTFSAAEDMAAGFDMLDRGKLIGQPTGGSTGQPLSFQLPGGGRARVCTKHDSYADGTEFVGIGIQPDISVKLTLADFRNHLDRTLEVAKEELLKATASH